VFRKASSLAIETFSAAALSALQSSNVRGTITPTEGFAESELWNFGSLTRHPARS
jgi:hypothetical protein